MLGYVNHLLTSQKCIFHLGFSLDGRWLSAEPAKVFVVLDDFPLLSALDATLPTRGEVTALRDMS